MIRLEDITVAYDDRIILNPCQFGYSRWRNSGRYRCQRLRQKYDLTTIMGLQKRRAAGYTLTAKILRTIRKKDG